MPMFWYSQAGPGPGFHAGAGEGSRGSYVGGQVESNGEVSYDHRLPEAQAPSRTAQGKRKQPDMMKPEEADLFADLDDDD